MKTLYSAALAALICASLATSPAAAQQFQQGANAPAFHIAVVDMNFIFLNHSSFKGQMDSLKKQMEGIEESLKADRDRIAQLEKQLATLNPGTPDYKNLDNQIATAKASFNLKMNRQRKALMEQESKLYYQTYTQVKAVIEQYATQNKIGLVLRFSGDKLDPNNPQALIKAINNPIVFQNQIDITGDVLARLNGASAANVGSRPAANPPR